MVDLSASSTESAPLGPVLGHWWATGAFDTRQTERSKTPGRVASAAAYALGLGDGRPAVWHEIETGVLSGPQVGPLREWPQPPH
jgi:hypothetical protein